MTHRHTHTPSRPQLARSLARPPSHPLSPTPAHTHAHMCTRTHAGTNEAKRARRDKRAHTLTLTHTLMLTRTLSHARTHTRAMYACSRAHKCGL